MMAGGEAAAEQAAVADGGATPASFEAFYAATQPTVYRALVLTLRDAALAEEATAEAYTRCWQRWSAVAGYGNPSGWVYRVGLNWSRSRWRRLQRQILQPSVGGVASVEPAEPPDPVLAAALAGLPLRQRSVLVLRFWLDWPVDRVAETLRIAPGTVRSRQHRGLAALREILEADDGA